MSDAFLELLDHFGSSQLRLIRTLRDHPEITRVALYVNAELTPDVVPIAMPLTGETEATSEINIRDGAPSGQRRLQAVVDCPLEINWDALLEERQAMVMRNLPEITFRIRRYAGEPIMQPQDGMVYFNGTRRLIAVVSGTEKAQNGDRRVCVCPVERWETRSVEETTQRGREGHRFDSPYWRWIWFADLVRLGYTMVESGYGDPVGKLAVIQHIITQAEINRPTPLFYVRVWDMDNDPLAGCPDVDSMKDLSRNHAEDQLAPGSSVALRLILAELLQRETINVQHLTTCIRDYTKEDHA